jgi:3-deoxy-7-phosphoheptulonate synthase
LLIDYELPMLRHKDGEMWLASTHWPWIGERTRQCDGAHVGLLSEVVNPVACKIGPDATISDVTGLCARLDPRREPGRLTFIARMGAGRTASRLPALVSAVRTLGHPVIWLTDPMHGNTVTTSGGVKTRYVETIVQEVVEFRRAVAEAGGIAGGMHLEATPDDVVECLSASADSMHVGDNYRTFCDPRLNARQAMQVVSSWSQ